MIGVIDKGRKSLNRDDTDFCVGVISAYFDLGKSLGKSEQDIKESIDHYLVGIYEALGMYLDAFEMMKFMATYSQWVYLPYQSKTLLWAREKNRLYELSSDIDWRIVHDANEIDVVEFKEYLVEVQKIENSI